MRSGRRYTERTRRKYMICRLIGLIIVSILPITCLIMGVCKIIDSYNDNSKVVAVSAIDTVETTEYPHIAITTTPNITQVTTTTVTERHVFYDITDDEASLLTRLAMAEAEDQDIYGKALVILTVLNRVEQAQNDPYSHFEDTITGVIFQDNQFSPIDDGRFYEVTPNKECDKALELVLHGWNESQGALYFESCDNCDNWHSQNLTYLFSYSDFRFYE